MTPEEIAKVRSIFKDEKLTEEQKLYNAHFNGDWKRQDFYRPTNEDLARMARYEWKPGPGFRERMCPDMERIDLEGRFANFDIPTLILEAKWDLTWNTDKPGKMLKNHPGAKLVVLERSGHSAFDDEPDAFFSTLSDFVKSAKAAPAPAPDRMGTRIEWPPAVALKINAMQWTGEDKRALDLFAEAKTAQLADADSWIKLGIVLYDGKHYPEALEAFGQVTSVQKGEPIYRFVAHCWQGHVLDLMERREDAIGEYRQALKIDIGDQTIQHDQYGMVIGRKWVEERLKTPFVRN
jgi:tetratricopeptide (TPR) repeat protein